MAIEHVDIPDGERHEPNGADGAVTDQIIASNGDGTTRWVAPSALVNPADFTIERLVNGESTAGTQGPTSVDEVHQIEFGPALNGPSDPVQLFSNGSIQVNESGLYRFKVFFQFGRSSGTGVSIVHLRYLVNGVQQGTTLTAKIEDADAVRVFSDVAWLEFDAGDLVTYEMVRDSTGSNDGLLISTDPTISGWNSSPTALARVERFIQG